MAIIALSYDCLKMQKNVLQNALAYSDYRRSVNQPLDKAAINRSPTVLIFYPHKFPHPILEVDLKKLA